MSAKIDNTENKKEERTGKLWTDEEIKMLLNAFIGGMDTQTIAKNLNRTNKGITSKLYHLGFNLVKWNNNELKILIKEVANGTNPQAIGKKLRKPTFVVQNKINGLGLKEIDTNFKDMLNKTEVEG